MNSQSWEHKTADPGKVKENRLEKNVPNYHCKISTKARTARAYHCLGSNTKSGKPKVEEYEED